jgi:adenylate cyclase
LFILINLKTKQKFFLDREITYIGTFENSDIKVEAENDTRVILKEEENNILLLKKLGSVYIGNKPAIKKVLENGDRILIGNDTFIFNILENEEELEDNALHEYLFIDNDASQQENEKFITSLVALNNFAHQVSSILDFGTLLNVIMELAIKIIKTEKGFLLFYDTKTETISIKAGLNIDKEVEEPDKFNRVISNKILNSLKETSPININSFTINEFPQIKSILAAGLKARNTVIGYICLINKIKPEKDFNERDKYLIESLATQAAIAIDNSLLYEKVKNETNLRNNLQRYLPRNIVAKVMENKINLAFVGELHECSTLFADICGFTAISSELKPQQIVSLLNQYLTSMTRVIFSFNGTVDKFMGDGIMAVFGVPLFSQEYAKDAVLAAIEMNKQIDILRNKFLEEFGIKNFNVRIGINTGTAVYGNIGSPQRMDLTVVGDSVNIAARLETHAPPGGILISDKTYEKVKSLVRVSEWEPITVKGKSEPIKVYEVIEKFTPENIGETIDNTMRMHIRVPLKTFVSITKSGARSHGLIRDISIGGVSISTVGNYNPEEEIELTFKLNNNISFRNIKGQVKYIEKSMFEGIHNKMNIIMGVEFIDLKNDKSKEIINFINSESLK